jgi:uncharacterized protein (DUF1697 family)
VETWLILLRGINVGGQRPVAMAELRASLSEMGFVDPATYIQSGNVIVGSRRAKTRRGVSSIERRLSDTFGHDARVVVRDAAEMSRIVRGIPKDWDVADASMRYNVIFLTDAIRPREVLDAVALKPGIESARAGSHVVYWSAPRATLTRTSMVKLSSHPAYREMTVRNLRTTLMLFDLMRQRTAA